MGGFLEELNIKSVSKSGSDFLTNDEMATYLDDFKNGRIPMGLSTGSEHLDKYFRFKKGNLVIVNGHDNIGKTEIIVYLMVVSAILHKWNWVIFCSENRTVTIGKKIMQFYAGKPVMEMTKEEHQDALLFLNTHFKIMNNDKIWTAIDLLNFVENVAMTWKVDGFLTDPYNSLEMDYSLIKKVDSTHDYHYKVATRYRMFKEKNKIASFINMHAATEALRKTYKDGTKFLDYRGEEHTIGGHPMPPSKSDTEGGGKFPNRTDEFITLHRFTQHEKLWNQTHFHMRKNKDNETGGKPTPLDEPICFEMLPKGCKFLVNGVDVIQKIRFGATYDSPNPINSMKGDINLLSEPPRQILF